MPFAVFEDKKLIDYGVYTTKGDFLEEKMNFQYEKIKELIEEYNIDVVVLEEVFMGRNMRGAKSSISAQSAMRLGTYHMGKICFVVLATKWRKGIIKSGQKIGVKEQAVNYVNKFYDLDLEYHKSRTKTDDDMAEAIIMVEGLVWGRYTLDDVKMFKEEKK